MNEKLMKVLLIITIGLGIFTIITKTLANSGEYNLIKSIDYYIEKNK